MRFGGFTGFSGAFDEGFEDPVLGLVVECQFGMPLYAEAPSFFRLDSLDNIARACCGNSNARGRLSDGITMQADNFRQTPDAQDLCEVAVRDQVNRVARQNQVPPYNVFIFAKVSDRSAEGDVYYLAATADAEDGQPALSGRVNERYFEVVTQPMNQSGQVGVTAVKLRVHVAAASQENAVNFFFIKESFYGIGADYRVAGCIGAEGNEASAGFEHCTLVGGVGYADSSYDCVIQREGNTRGVGGQAHVYPGRIEKTE